MGCMYRSAGRCANQSRGLMFQGGGSRVELEAAAMDACIVEHEQKATAPKCGSGAELASGNERDERVSQTSSGPGEAVPDLRHAPNASFATELQSSRYDAITRTAIV
jgi:hypothetical protein